MVEARTVMVSVVLPRIPHWYFSQWAWSVEADIRDLATNGEENRLARATQPKAA
jgi:hypothetical protein